MGPSNVIEQTPLSTDVHVSGAHPPAFKAGHPGVEPLSCKKLFKSSVTWSKRTSLMQPTKSLTGVRKFRDDAICGGIPPKNAGAVRSNVLKNKG